MIDRYTIVPNSAQKRIIIEHIEEIIKHFGGVNEAHEKLQIPKPTLWYWKNFRQRIEPKHALYVCNRCNIAKLEKLIPQYKGLFK